MEISMLRFFPIIVATQLWPLVWATAVFRFLIQASRVRISGWGYSSCRLFYRFPWALERARGPVHQERWEGQDGAFFSVRPQWPGLLCSECAPMAGGRDGWPSFVARWLGVNGWSSPWAGATSRNWIVTRAGPLVALMLKDNWHVPSELGIFLNLGLS